MTLMPGHEDIKDFVEQQLAIWSLAGENYDALRRVRRRIVSIGDLTIGIQFNPARAISTGAAVDPVSIRKRKCFLCAGNRPEQQIKYPFLENWDLLVNPYPIFPIHLTIAHKQHIPQTSVPLDIMEMAIRLPGMTVFFNGAKAGASAPDHFHLQAVLKDEIPLIRIAETYHPYDCPGIMPSSKFGIDLPFFFLSGLIPPEGEDSVKILVSGLKTGGPSPDGTLSDTSLVNTFFWTDCNHRMRFIVIPRKAHRPECYYSPDNSNRMVSPGCIDMGGIIITPRESDFDCLSAEEIHKIYTDVAFTENDFK